MLITKHAQSCLLIEAHGTRILIDPGYFVFQDEGLTPDSFPKIDLLIFTHEHKDHFDIENVIRIIELSKLVVLAPQSVADQLKNVANVEVTGEGYSKQFAGVKVEAFVSEHGPLPNGNTPPEVVGVVIDDGEKRLYTPGDSVWLNQSTRADIVAVPICGKVVMDIATAKTELEKLQPELAVPIHYDNPVFPVDVADFESAMQDSPVAIKVLKWGELLDI